MVVVTWSQCAFY